MDRQFKMLSDGEPSEDAKRQRVESQASGGSASGEAGRRHHLFTRPQELHERHESTEFEVPASQQGGAGDLPGDRSQLEEQDTYNQNQTVLKQLLKDLEQKVTSLDQQRAKRQQRAAPSEGPVSWSHDRHHQQDTTPLAGQQVQGEVPAWLENLSQTSSTSTRESKVPHLLLEENEQFDEQNPDHQKWYKELARLVNDHSPLQSGPSQQWEPEPSWPIGSSLDEDCPHFAHFSQSDQALAPYLVHPSTDDPFQISMRPLDTPARNEQSMLQHQQEEVFDIDDFSSASDNESSHRDLLEAHGAVGRTLARSSIVRETGLYNANSASDPQRRAEVGAERFPQPTDARQQETVPQQQLAGPSDQAKVVSEFEYLNEKAETGNNQQQQYTYKGTKITRLVYSSEHNMLIEEEDIHKKNKKTKTIPQHHEHYDQTKDTSSQSLPEIQQPLAARHPTDAQRVEQRQDTPVQQHEEYNHTDLSIQKTNKRYLRNLLENFINNKRIGKNKFNNMLNQNKVNNKMNMLFYYYYALKQSNNRELNSKLRDKYGSIARYTNELLRDKYETIVYYKK